jgi:hypothetical protein
MEMSGTSKPSVSLGGLKLEPGILSPLTLAHAHSPFGVYVAETYQCTGCPYNNRHA